MTLLIKTAATPMTPKVGLWMLRISKLCLQKMLIFHKILEVLEIKYDYIQELFCFCFIVCSLIRHTVVLVEVNIFLLFSAD